MRVEINVPKFVRWIAVDSCGECWGFSRKPKSDFGTWDTFKGDATLLYKGKPPKNSKDELYTWS